MKTIRLTAAAFAATLILSCVHKSDIPSEPQISFSQQVQPIIIGNCTQEGCHGTNKGGEEERLELLTYANVARLVSPGNARQSRLYRAITGNGAGTMPPAGYMSEANIQTIYLWIEQGAKNN